jgi:hypothetical protein
MRLLTRAILVVLVATIVLGAVGFASGRVEIVRHWSLYSASGPGQSYELFLGPFPSAKTCQAEGQQIIRDGGRAYCGDSLALSFDRKREGQLFWEFLSVANPWVNLCGHRTSHGR